MSKLFKLKEWLTLEEAAKHLSSSLAEEVTVADIYRLSLDGHLLLSMYFPNHAKASMGKVVGWEGVEYLSDEMMLFLAAKSGKSENEIEPIIVSDYIGNDQFINWDEDVVSIEGVWDLAMLASERLDVEHRFLQLSGGPELELVNINGTLVRQGNVYARIMDQYKTHSISVAEKTKATAMEFVAQCDIPEELKKNASALFDEMIEQENPFSSSDLEPQPEVSYYPAGTLPNDGVYVVRVKAIVDFLNRLDETPITDKPLSTKERNSMLKLVAALCKEANYDINAKGIANSLEKATEQTGQPLSDDTIRNILKQVKELFGDQ